MKSTSISKIVGIVFTSFLLLFGVSATALGQDRDVTEGSTSGSIRPDVTEKGSGPRTRMLTPDKRAGLVSEFDMFRGVEPLLNAPSFESLKDNYTVVLERAATLKPIATDLAPLKYLVFRLMALNLSRTHTGIDAERLNQSMIDSYIKTKSFLPPILSAGVSESEARDAERNAVLAIRKAVRARGRT